MKRERRDRDEKRGERKRSKAPARRKSCRVCTEQGTDLNYKNYRTLQMFMTDRGKIIPRRITGTCAKHQRDLTISVRRARLLALIPFTSVHAITAG